MPKINRPRFGSLQFYPRKRVAKFLPAANWINVENSDAIKSLKEHGLLGFIVYKVGMSSALIKDNTEHVLTKGKKITIPVTILEAPNMKAYSIRFYKNKRPVNEIVVSNEKELKKILRVTKQVKDSKAVDSEIKNYDYDDVSIIAYSIVKETSIKKSPDIIEIGIKGESKEKKLEYAKSLIGKEITLKDFLNNYTLLDFRGLTKGKGLSGPVARFGIGLKGHKSEKGVRRPGSLGPWHPSRVTFKAPQAGQLGMFTRIHYNQKVIGFGEIKEKDINPSEGFKHYGKINTNYLIVNGSVQGPQKRQILITPAFRPTKDQSKKKYEFIQLMNKQ